jgi:hypothetical protein
LPSLRWDCRSRAAAAPATRGTSPRPRAAPRSTATETERSPPVWVTKFILIAGQQAALAGVAPADIQEIAEVLDSYRGGVRNK